MRNMAENKQWLYNIIRMFVVTVCLMTGAAYAAAAAAPTYEETIAFIEGNVTHPFVEHSRCEFIYNDNFRFSIKALNSTPRVTDWSVVYRCAQAKQCIDPRNSSKLATEITIDVRDMKSANKVAQAMSHLIELCGGVKIKENLF
jgi:hypothetical protein